MKRMRNVLVHRYGRIEDEKVYEVLENKSDFVKFKEEVLKVIANDSKEVR